MLPDKKCLDCVVGSHDRVIFPKWCTCSCHKDSKEVTSTPPVAVTPIPTLSGRFVDVTYRDNVGIVVSQSGGSTVSRIILSREAAKDLSSRLMLAVIGAIREDNDLTGHPAIAEDDISEKA